MALVLPAMAAAVWSGAAAAGLALPPGGVVAAPPPSHEGSSRGAGGIEKSTLDVNGRGIQPRWMKSRSASADVVVNRGAVEEIVEGQACPTDGSCEACQ